MTEGHIAVIDIGKTNAKLALINPETLAEMRVLTRPNAVLPGPPYRHFDVDGIWAFILRGLTELQAAHKISAISITTHGAAGALLKADGTLAAPILDYEQEIPADVATAYNAIRPPFAETGAPRLPGGLNLGAQLHWQLTQDPALLERISTIVTYPQYWAHRLTGVAATDVTSLGCHTDLWRPAAGRFSDLVTALGIEDKIAPPRKPGDVLGAILPDIAQETGLSADTPVICGIHDSNASLLPHLLYRDPPFSVVSTGTWVIALGVKGRAVTLDPARDTLMNVNALGDPVPSARFMGGREFDILTANAAVDPTAADIDAVLEKAIMLLPSAMSDCGPFQGQKTEWIGTAPEVGTGARTAAVSFYLALTTAQSLALIGHQGDIIVEGPFGRNEPYLKMLAAATGSNVIAAGTATGTTEGAALLYLGSALPMQNDAACRLEPDEALLPYAKAWSDHVAMRVA